MIIDKANCRDASHEETDANPMKDRNCMRYDAKWLIECLLMRIKSPRA